MENNIPIRSLILVGGMSTRMGFPKHLLRTSLASDSQSLLLHVAQAHHDLANDMNLAEHFSKPVAISVRDEAQQKQLLDYMAGMNILQDAELIIDTEKDVGPNAGLLSAHRFDQSAHWIVTGCDYPRVTAEALHQLVTRHLTRKPAVTCFVNDSGFTEPLLAIWSPSSLKALHQHLLHDNNIGPSIAIRKLAQDSYSGADDKMAYWRGVEKIRAEQSNWIKDVNTIRDWQMLQEE
jgi:molybdopterin-guanine dinucleotide biosynthesis protein A